MSIRSITLGIVVIVVSGCGAVDGIHEAIYGKYHRVSPATGGIYITIKRHATDRMVLGFNLCKSHGRSDDDCGREVLKAARNTIVPALSGPAKLLWNGDLPIPILPTNPIILWHPNVGNAFADDEAGDFAQAVKNLRSREHQCLRIHWKPTGENWTTVQDEGVAECSLGEPLK